MEKIDLQALDRLLDWTKRKARVQASDGPRHFVEREIWWASIGENVGSEENGKHERFERPVLILRKSNKDILFVILLSSVQKEGSWYMTFDFLGKATVALLTQGRSISSKRLIRKMGSIDRKLFIEIREAFISHLISESPAYARDPRGLRRGESVADPIDGGSSGPQKRQM